LIRPSAANERLVRDGADHAAIDPCQAGNDRFTETRIQIEKLSYIDNSPDGVVCRDLKKTLPKSGGREAFNIIEE